MIIYPIICAAIGFYAWCERKNPWIWFGIAVLTTPFVSFFLLAFSPIHKKCEKCGNVFDKKQKGKCPSCGSYGIWK